MKEVKMYTLSTCPWCKKTKQFFKDHDISFEYIDYDLTDDETREKILKEMKSHGANGFPYVKIGDEVVVGYNPEEYSSLMGINE
ncbi:MAG: glutaredoxin family protein [Methanobacterium sp.]